jgi:hypothetical protein
MKLHKTTPLGVPAIKLGVAVKAVTLSDETHLQVFRRLTDPIFNGGAMHGTPGQKKGASR